MHILRFLLCTLKKGKLNIYTNAIVAFVCIMLLTLMAMI